MWQKVRKGASLCAEFSLMQRKAELEKMKLSGGELKEEKDKISGEISALTALLADYRVKISTALF